jgi:serine/threonine protein phosphatase PrpC
MIKPEVAAWSDVGRERTLNEDRVFYQILDSSDAEPIVMCIVADGMGGHLGGEVASHWAVETLKRELADLFMPADPRQTVQMTGAEMRLVVQEAQGKIRPSDVVLMRRVRKAVERANQAVRQYTFHRPQEAMGAGSTVTLALIKGLRAYVANVGDSRTYLLREGQLVQLTQDHSVVAELIAAGRLPVEESYAHPKAGLITRCLGCMDQVEVDIEPFYLEAGDCLLLCSDGLWSMVHDSMDIVEIIEAAPDLDTAVRNLVDAANREGGQDNISVGLVRLDEEPDIPK